METTKFSDIYSVFLSKITDDMYLEITEEETLEMLPDLLEAAIPKFEFPRVNIFDYSLENNTYNIKLSKEEINVIAAYMAVEWINQQLASVELTRMKYSGSDFKLTSQANHMAKLMALKANFTNEGFHLQRLYKRRKQDKDGIFHSTFGYIMTPIEEGRA